MYKVTKITSTTWLSSISSAELLCIAQVATELAEASPPLLHFCLCHARQCLRLYSAVCSRQISITISYIYIYILLIIHILYSTIFATSISTHFRIPTMASMIYIKLGNPLQTSIMSSSKLPKRQEVNGLKQQRHLENDGTNRVFHQNRPEHRALISWHS